MQPLNDLQSVLRTLRDGIGKGYWTMQDLDVPPPGYVGKNFRNLLRDQPADIIFVCHIASMNSK